MQNSSSSPTGSPTGENSQNPPLGSLFKQTKDSNPTHIAPLGCVTLAVRTRLQDVRFNERERPPPPPNDMMWGPWINNANAAGSSSQRRGNNTEILLQSPAGVPTLLNQKLKIKEYDGTAYSNRVSYQIKNILTPTIDPFHCSGAGVGWTVIIEAQEVFTVSHMFFSGPGQRCNEPIRSGLVWIREECPKMDWTKEYTEMSQEAFDAIQESNAEEGAQEESVPDLFFCTDKSTRKCEVICPKWLEGKYIMVKFLDTHNKQENIDVGVVAAAGFWGKKASEQKDHGSYFNRTVRNLWVHPRKLTSQFSAFGWVCDGRDFCGGCRSRLTDFHQTNVYTVTFRCQDSGFDLCEHCVADPSFGKITPASVLEDLQWVADRSPKAGLRRSTHGTNRIVNHLKRSPHYLLRYLRMGLLDVIEQMLNHFVEQEASGRERSSIRRGAGSIGSALRAAESLKKGGSRPPPLRLLRTVLDQLYSLQDKKPTLTKSTENGWQEARIQSLVTPTTNHIRVASARPSGGPSSQRQMRVLRQGTNPGMGSTFMSQPGYEVETNNVWRVPLGGNEDIVMSTVALHEEVMQEDQSKVDLAKVARLLESNADLTMINGAGHSVLTLAAKSGSREVIECLLKHGLACPDFAAPVGSPLVIAINNNNFDATDVLLNVGACPYGVKFQDANEEIKIRMREALQKWATEDNMARPDSIFGLTLEPAGTPEPNDPHVSDDMLEEWREAFPVRFCKLLLVVAAGGSLQRAFPTLSASPTAGSLASNPSKAGGNQGVAASLAQAVTARGSTASSAAGGLSSSGGPSKAKRTDVIMVITEIVKVAEAKAVTEAFLPNGRPSIEFVRLLDHMYVSGSLSFAQAGLALLKQLLIKGDPKMAAVLRNQGAEIFAKRLAAGLGGFFCSSSSTSLNADGEDLEYADLLQELCDKLERGDQQGLLILREILAKSDAGDTTVPSSYAIQQYDIPTKVLQFLQGQKVVEGQLCNVTTDANENRWQAFAETFDGDHLQRLLFFLHHVIAVGEELPVWRFQKEKGLKVLTEPVQLSLGRSNLSLPEDEWSTPESEGTTNSGKSSSSGSPNDKDRAKMESQVRIEPLALMKELRRHVLCTRPVCDDQYLNWCCDLVGRHVYIDGEEGDVINFEILPQLKVGVHTIRYIDGREERTILAVRKEVEVDQGQAKNMDAWLKAGNVPQFPGLNVLFKKLEIMIPNEKRLAKAVKELRGYIQEGVEGTMASTEVINADLKSRVAFEIFSKCQFTVDQDSDGTLHIQNEAQLCPDLLNLVECLPHKDDSLERLTSNTETVVDSIATETADPEEPVHTVYIMVSDDFPFDICWPMVRDDIVRAVRELPSNKRGWPKGGWQNGFSQMDEAVKAGVQENSCGPIARGLTLREAERLVARVSGGISAGITIDRSVPEELNAAAGSNPYSKSSSSSGPASCLLGTRVQFNLKKPNSTQDNWKMGVLVGRVKGESESLTKLIVINEDGILFENLGVSKVRIPKGKRRRSRLGHGGYSFSNLIQQAQLLWNHSSRSDDAGGEGSGGTDASGAAGAIEGVRQFLFNGGEAGLSMPGGRWIEMGDGAVIFGDLGGAEGEEMGEEEGEEDDDDVLDDDDLDGEDDDDDDEDGDEEHFEDGEVLMRVEIGLIPVGNRSRVYYAFPSLAESFDANLRWKFPHSRDEDDEAFEDFLDEFDDASPSTNTGANPAESTNLSTDAPIRSVNEIAGTTEENTGVAGVDQTGDDDAAREDELMAAVAQIHGDVVGLAHGEGLDDENEEDYDDDDDEDYADANQYPTEYYSEQDLPVLEAEWQQEHQVVEDKAPPRVPNCQARLPSALAIPDRAADWVQDMHQPPPYPHEYDGPRTNFHSYSPRPHLESAQRYRGSSSSASNNPDLYSDQYARSQGNVPSGLRRHLARYNATRAASQQDDYAHNVDEQYYPENLQQYYAVIRGMTNPYGETNMSGAPPPPTRDAPLPSAGGSNATGVPRNNTQRDEDAMPLRLQQMLEMSGNSEGWQSGYWGEPMFEPPDMERNGQASTDRHIERIRRQRSRDRRERGDREHIMRMHYRDPSDHSPRNRNARSSADQDDYYRVRVPYSYEGVPGNIRAMMEAEGAAMAAELQDEDAAMAGEDVSPFVLEVRNEDMPQGSEPIVIEGRSSQVQRLLEAVSSGPAAERIAALEAVTSSSGSVAQRIASNYQRSSSGPEDSARRSGPPGSNSRATGSQPTYFAEFDNIMQQLGRSASDSNAAGNAGSGGNSNSASGPALSASGALRAMRELQERRAGGGSNSSRPRAEAISIPASMLGHMTGASTTSTKKVAADALRYDFDALQRATDASSLAASLDHPIVARVTPDDLNNAIASDDEGSGQGKRKPTGRSPAMKVDVRFSPHQDMDHASDDAWSLMCALLAFSSNENQTPANTPQIALDDTHELYYQIHVPNRSDTNTLQVAPEESGHSWHSAFESKLAKGNHRFASLGTCEVVGSAVELLRMIRQKDSIVSASTESSWISTKLDRKMRFQLEDALAVSTGALPQWVSALPREFPFLFSLKTRKMMLKYMGMGSSFAVHWMQQQQLGDLLQRRVTVQTELTSAGDARRSQALSQEMSNIEEQVVRSPHWLGCLKCTLVRTVKGDLFLPMAEHIMSILVETKNVKNMLEIQFDGESGFGSAVTKNFFVEIVKALQNRAENKRIP
eukprot:gene820-987_t